MTREEAHTLLEVMAIELTGELADIECPVTERTKLLGKQLEAIDMAIKALQTEGAQGVGRYENAMQKLQEMPKYLNGIKEKQIKKISVDYGVKIDEEIK